MVLVTSTTLKPDQANKLQKLIDAIPEILASAENPEYDEIYGYRICPDGQEHVNILVRNEILLKFLAKANFDLTKTRDDLVSTFNWRHEFQVLHAAYYEKFDPIFDKLGFIARFPNNTENFCAATWNIYTELSRLKDEHDWLLRSPYKEGIKYRDKDLLASQKTPYVRWFVGQRERSLSLLDFTNKDNCMAVEVHDWKNVSILKVEDDITKANGRANQIFRDHYPGWTSKRVLLNMPRFWKWTYASVKCVGTVNAKAAKLLDIETDGNASSTFGVKNLPAEHNGGIFNEKVDSREKLRVKSEEFRVPEYVAVLMRKLENPDTEDLIDLSDSESIVDPFREKGDGYLLQRRKKQI